MKATIEEYLEATRLGMPYTGRASSSKTLATYGESLRRVERLIGKPLRECGPRCGETFLKRADEAGLSQSTKNVTIAAAQGFFKWAIGNELFTGKNPFEHIRAKSGARKLPVFLKHEEALRLLDSIEEAQRLKREKALSSGNNTANFGWSKIDYAEKYGLFFRVMYFGGLRMDEVVSLKKKNVREGGLLIEGKGSKERFVPMLPEILDRLRVYMAEHPYTDYVFYGEAGQAHGVDLNQPMNARSARAAFNEGVALAGMSEELTPHKLRHSFATHALAETGRIEVVQKILGHANPATTLIYAQVSDKALSDEYAKVFEK